MKLRIIIGLVVFALIGGPALANGYALEVIDRERTWTFSPEELMSLAQEQLETTTPWDEATNVYQGIYLSTLLATLNIKAELIHARALNDYKIDIPVKDALAAEAFIAVYRDGKPMPIRKRGPYWIIFPWSDNPKTKESLLTSWSIWQMVELRTQAEN